MSRYRRLIGISCLLPPLAGAALQAHDARACGACFHPVPPPNPPPNEVETQVTGHRMAFAMSPTQSVLWDQIKYSGNPKEFAWVLPVKPGTQVELSTDAWLAALDANTATIIEPPPFPTCYAKPTGGGGFGGDNVGGGVDTAIGGFSGGGSVCSSQSKSGTFEAPAGGGGGGCSCDHPGSAGSSWYGSTLPSSDNCSSSSPSVRAGGAQSAGGAVTGSGGAQSGSGGGSIVAPPPPPPVTVQVQETVGPYDIVIVHASMGEALDTWLITNGFEIPLNIQPILDAYVAQNLDFVALKLRPGANVSAMRPVRVIEPGADPTLPLRMISAGAGAHVGITLWVISEGRYEPQNFPMASIDFSKLVYDVGNKRSNYAELRELALNGGVVLDAGASPPALEAGLGVDAVADAPSPADAAADAVPDSDTVVDADSGEDAAVGDAGTTPAAATPKATGYWLTEFAGLANLGVAGVVNREAGVGLPGTTPALLSAYQQACTPATPPNPCDSGVGDTGSSSALEADGAADAASQSDVGADGPLEAGASDSAADDGSTEDAEIACTPPAPTVCDDPQVAFVGLSWGNIWITRLEADLPYAALARDLVLQASASQTSADNVHRAQSWVDGDPCTLGSIGTQSVVVTTRSVPPRTDLARASQSCALGSRSPADLIGTCAMASFTALWLARRKSRAPENRSSRA